MATPVVKKPGRTRKPRRFIAFGKRLRDLLERRDQRQKDVADALGLSRPAVSSWLLGLTMPTPEHMEKMAERFAVPLEWLRSGRGPTPSLPDRPERRRRPPNHPSRSNSLVEATRIAILRSADDPRRFESWDVPAYALPTHVSFIKIFPAPAALAPVNAGDFVFIDLTQRDVKLGGLWLIEAPGIGLLLARARNVKVQDRLMLKLVCSDGLEFDPKTIRTIIGRVTARFTKM